MSNPENNELNESGTENVSFAHLRNAAKVISEKNNKSILSALVGVIVITMILILMFSGGHKQKAVQQAQPQAVNQDLVLQQNAQRLDTLNGQRAAATQPSESLGFPDLNADVDNKAMMARRNAPTQMYSASAPVTADAAAGTSSNNMTVLAGQDSFSSYANSQSASASTVVGTQIRHPAYTIVEGEFIHAALETAINSDLPGMVRAVVTQPVYAYVGEKPIIPAGSRLVGQYTSTSSNGSATTRVFVIWNRIITPGGTSIMINSPGADELGRGGMGADAIDTHFGEKFGTAALLSIIGAGAANVGVNSDDEYNSASQYRTAIAGSFQESAQDSMGQNMSIKPTLYVHQGNSVNVFVAHDLDLYNVLGSS